MQMARIGLCKWLNWANQISVFGCPWPWLGSDHVCHSLYLEKVHPQCQSEFLMPFAPSQSPSQLQKLLPLPFYLHKQVPNIISTSFPVFLGLFFPGQRYMCPLISNLIHFLTVLAAFQAFSLPAYAPLLCALNH